MANYGENGRIEFNKLWNLMNKKELNKQWLKNNGIHSNTISKLTKNKIGLTELANEVDITLANLSILKNNKARAVRLSTLNAICKALNCQPGDIMEYKN